MSRQTSRRYFHLAVTLCLIPLTKAGAQLAQDHNNGQSQIFQNRAYQALAAKEYDKAILEFGQALQLEPRSARTHKDLAYTLLKTGDNVGARDEFARAMELDARDETAALEFAFLAYETKEPIQARRTFDRLRHSASPATRATAQQAFRNIDEPLAEGIARWQEALRRAGDPNAPSTFSAHWELGQLAEKRDELALAAEQFTVCRMLKPQLPEILLILARVWNGQKRIEESRAALLAASRSPDSRTAELALDQLGTRYPYPYEFLAALKIDPRNTELRKELAYLYLAMHEEPEAIAQFEALLEIDSQDAAARKQLDLLRGLKTRPPSAIPSANATPAELAPDAKALGKKSLAMGYLPDAVKYLQRAHEQNPNDADVMLQLGWAYNQSKDDAEAIDWFDRARRAEDPQIAAEASRAYHNLRGDTLPQTTIWTLPMFSSRWKDLFSYGQIKRTIPLPFLGTANRFFSFYLSARFAGDLKSGLPTHVVTPQYLSESSFILAGGVASRTWHHLTGWAEAGEAINYLPFRKDIGATMPDYRGGLNYAKGFGHLLTASATPGAFYETTADAVYISRFNKDWLFYSQHRAGQTFRLKNGLAGQLLFNFNYTRDVKSEYWANTIEIGPGFRFRMPWMPPNMFLSTDLLHGFYLGPSPLSNYNDIRVSVWYAVTK